MLTLSWQITMLHLLIVDVLQVLGCIKMGCWTQSIKTFHVKIILLDKQEKIQEIQVSSVQ